MSPQLKVVPGKILIAGEEKPRTGALITPRKNTEDPFRALVLRMPNNSQEPAHVAPATFFPENTSTPSSGTSVFSSKRTPSLALVRAINADPNSDHPSSSVETLAAIEAVRERFVEDGANFFGKYALRKLFDRLYIITATNGDNLVKGKAQELLDLITRKRGGSPTTKKSSSDEQVT